MTVSIYISGPSGVNSSSLSIGGLPFQARSNHYFTNYCEGASDGKMGMLRVGNLGTNIVAYYPNTSSALRTAYVGTDLGGHFIGSFTYMTS